MSDLRQFSTLEEGVLTQGVGAIETLHTLRIEQSMSAEIRPYADLQESVAFSIVGVGTSRVFQDTKTVATSRNSLSDQITQVTQYCLTFDHIGIYLTEEIFAHVLSDIATKEIQL